MIQFLELLETGLMVTAVTIAAVTVPVAVVTDAELPNLKPLIEIIEEK